MSKKEKSRNIEDTRFQKDSSDIVLVMKCDPGIFLTGSLPKMYHPPLVTFITFKVFPFDLHDDSHFQQSVYILHFSCFNNVGTLLNC